MFLELWQQKSSTERDWRAEVPWQKQGDSDDRWVVILLLPLHSHALIIGDIILQFVSTKFPRVFHT